MTAEQVKASQRCDACVGKFAAERKNRRKKIEEIHKKWAIINEQKVITTGV